MGIAFHRSSLRVTLIDSSKVAPTSALVFAMRPVADDCLLTLPVLGVIVVTDAAVSGSEQFMTLSLEKKKQLQNNWQKT